MGVLLKTAFIFHLPPSLSFILPAQECEGLCNWEDSKQFTSSTGKSLRLDNVWRLPVEGLLKLSKSFSRACPLPIMTATC